MVSTGTGTGTGGDGGLSLQRHAYVASSDASSALSILISILWPALLRLGGNRMKGRLSSPIRPESVTEFVDVVFGEPFRVHIAIPAYLAEDLIATKPTLG